MNELQTSRAARDDLSMPVPTAVAEGLSPAALRAAAAELLRRLDERARRIMARRFGLDGHRSETLHAIGAAETVTRERIRQIEHAVLRSFHALEGGAGGSAPMLSSVIRVRAALRELMRALGGVARHDMLTRLLGLTQDAESAALRFVLHSLPEVSDVRETSRLVRHYRLAEHVGPERILELAAAALRDARRLLSDEDLFAEIQRRTSGAFPEPVLRSVLSLSREIVRTPFGEWGLRGWPEATPRGVGDKAYIVLKRAGKPQHFTAITEGINGVQFDRRTAHPQTVHNELIRDERFVLVGRGLYALREWGYQPGTVADVLERILREAPRALPREELVTKVLKERVVKRNTIQLALQNRRRFSRDAEGHYTLVPQSEQQHSPDGTKQASPSEVPPRDGDR